MCIGLTFLHQCIYLYLWGWILCYGVVSGHALIRAQRIYAVDPLLIMHRSGISNTWGEKRLDITGRTDYRVFSSPSMIQRHHQNYRKQNRNIRQHIYQNSNIYTASYNVTATMCRFSDPLFNVSLQYWWMYSPTFDTYDEAVSACTAYDSCSGITKLPGKKKNSYYLGTRQ